MQEVVPSYNYPKLEFCADGRGNDDQWPFQEPIDWRYLPYKAYFLGLSFREQYLHFRILELPLIWWSNIHNVAMENHPFLTGKLWVNHGKSSIYHGPWLRTIIGLRDGRARCRNMGNGESGLQTWGKKLEWRITWRMIILSVVWSIPILMIVLGDAYS